MIDSIILHAEQLKNVRFFVDNLLEKQIYSLICFEEHTLLDYLRSP